MAALLSIATANPIHELTQSMVVEEMRSLFSERFPGFNRMAQVFDTAGVKRRQFAMPLEWYRQQRGWPERSEVYNKAATQLFIKAARSALTMAGLAPQDIDIIVAVSSTGIATPTLEARAAAAMGFRPDVQRVPVFGLGCAGGVSGLAVASRLARAQPGANVLFVTVELCSMAFRLDHLTKANMIACALFGDGAAACVVREGGAGIAEIGAGAEYMWPDTLDIMGWAVDDVGLGVILNRSIPEFAGANLRHGIGHLASKMGVEAGSVDRFICHPGGAKVIAAIEHAMETGEGALDCERAVLADHGNMSAPTALYVLKRVLERGAPDLSVLLALGPGFTLSALELRKAA